MHVTFNGIGVATYGRSQERITRGVCPKCGPQGIASYQTTRYFVFVYVPILSLGRRYVVDECPRCRRVAASMGEKDYMHWRSAMLQDAAEQVRAAPDDANVVHHAVETCCRFDDTDTFLESIAAPAEAHATEHPAIAELLGDGYWFFRLPEDAEAMYQLARTRAASARIDLKLAAALMLLERPDEAAAVAEPRFAALEPSEQHRIGPVLEGYLANGRSEQALQALEQIMEGRPDLRKDPYLRKLRAAAQRRPGHTAAYTPHALLNGRSQSDEKPKRSWSLTISPKAAMLIVPVLAMLVIGGYLSYCAYLGASCPAYLVNGTDVPYTVRINDDQYVATPRGAMKIRISEGTVTIDVLGAPSPVPTQTFELQSSSFLARPFQRTVHFINPDRSALLLWEEAEYVPAQSLRNAAYDYRYHAGNLVETFSKIDYVMEPMPAQIDLGRGNSATRQRVALEDAAFEDVLSVIFDTYSAEECSDVLQMQAKFRPGDPRIFDYLEYSLTADEIMKLVEPVLDGPAPAMEWRRLEQVARLAKEDAETVRDEYVDGPAKRPDDPIALYLAARLDEGRAAYEQFERAVTMGLASPRVDHRLMFWHQGRGEMEAALEDARRLLAFDEGSWEYRRYFAELASANGLCDEVSGISVGWHRADQTDTDAALIRVDHLLTCDQPEAAAHTAQVFVGALRRAGEAAFANTMKRDLDAQAAYVAGDLDSFTTLMLEEDHAWSHFAGHLTAGRLHDAQSALEQLEWEAEFDDYLLIAIVAALDDDEATMDIALTTAARLLRDSESEAWTDFADLLEGTYTGATDPTVDLASERWYMLIVHTAASMLDEARRGEHIEIARKLNFKPGFPARIVERAIARWGEDDDAG